MKEQKFIHLKNTPTSTEIFFKIETNSIDGWMFRKMYKTSSTYKENSGVILIFDRKINDNKNK